jgi:hypothetical protein
VRYAKGRRYKLSEQQVSQEEVFVMVNILYSPFFLMLAEAVSPSTIDKEQTLSSDALIAVGVLGFLAATTIGSVAWYNSKRPPGWENKERPPIVPEVEPSDHPGLGTPES